MSTRETLPPFASCCKKRTFLGVHFSGFCKSDVLSLRVCSLRDDFLYYQSAITNVKEKDRSPWWLTIAENTSIGRRLPFHQSCICLHASGGCEATCNPKVLQIFATSRNSGRRTVKKFAQFLLAMIGHFLYCNKPFLQGQIAGVTLPSPRSSSSDLQEKNL